MSEKIKAVAFVSINLEKEFNELEEGAFEDKELYKFISRAKEDLIKDPFCGTRVPQRLIPKIYIDNHGINNLWKYDLPNAWRLLYSVVGDEVKIVSVILEWLSHKDYERRFGY